MMRTAVTLAMTAAMAAAGADNLTIVGVETVVIGSGDGAIPFVLVTTGDGRVGLGQASYGEDANETALLVDFVHQIAPSVLGLPAGYPAYVAEQIFYDNYKWTGALLFRCVAGASFQGVTTG